MEHRQRLQIFDEVKTRYNSFLASVLWKLTGDRELFGEAMQYALLGMWQNVEKLSSDSAGGYIYRIAMSANSKAWRNRIGRDGQLNEHRLPEKTNQEVGDIEGFEQIRRAVALLPEKQSKAIVMRYLGQKSYEDIACVLSCTEAAARSNVSKALAALKRRLSNG
ncbi:MAG: sigma-70 family RNA polymerase sigma factor [Sedimentisphaerales bacterium]|nr:sigma-70 family RNA polymerase sigma factor [Sedimentisphaerales bacterium]